MQLEYSNELKVGVAIVIAAFAAFAGIRFFQNVPLFGSSYSMYAEFDGAEGLVSGNPVRMKGVKIGSVEEVRLDPETQQVRIRLQLQQGTQIPKGSHARVAGISALGGVHIQIIPGPSENAPLSAGAVLSPPPEGTVLDRLTSRAPSLANKADSVLTNTNATMSQLSQQLRNPESDLRKTLVSLRQMSGDLADITDVEKQTIRQLLKNLEGVSSDLRAFTGENGDSLDVAVRRLNQSLARLNRSLASFEKTSATLDTITTKLNRGDGTAGRLMNDPGLYMKMDSAATRTNRILKEFRQNPGRYLEDVTLVKVF
jgi:phospholipid/cholesterol/gamma-HCH transport system substrate-binding protein